MLNFHHCQTSPWHCLVFDRWNLAHSYHGWINLTKMFYIITSLRLMRDYKAIFGPITESTQLGGCFFSIFREWPYRRRWRTLCLAIFCLIIRPIIWDFQIDFQVSDLEGVARVPLPPLLNFIKLKPEIFFNAVFIGVSRSLNSLAL